MAAAGAGGRAMNAGVSIGGRAGGAAGAGARTGPENLGGCGAAGGAAGAGAAANGANAGRTGAGAGIPAPKPLIAAAAFPPRLEPESPIAITPPHTEHRARTPPNGILAGSTRKIEPHSGQMTFIAFSALSL